MEYGILGAVVGGLVALFFASMISWVFLALDDIRKSVSTIEEKCSKN